MKRSTVVLIALVMLSAVAGAAAPPQLTTHQVWTLKESARAGTYYDDGIRLEFGFTPTLQAILGQESSWCEEKHRRDPLSWGCGQLTVRTAQLFDAGATTHKLMHNDRYNIWLAAAYLAYCRNLTHDWTQMVRCYKGRDTKDWQDYVKAIRQRIQDLPDSED